jgi:hypothetical protein
MAKNDTSDLEQRMLSKLAEIDRKIDDLTNERFALHRLIADVRKADLNRRDVTRRNSFDRIVIENEIIGILRASREPVKSGVLFEHIKRTNYKLKPATFRSYLHRLKERGHIKPVAHAEWQLVEFARKQA